MLDKSRWPGCAVARTLGRHRPARCTRVHTVMTVGAPLIDRKKYLSSRSTSYATSTSSKLIDDNNDYCTRVLLTFLLPRGDVADNTEQRTSGAGRRVAVNRTEHGAIERARTVVKRLITTPAVVISTGAVRRVVGINSRPRHSVDAVISSTHQTVIIHDVRAPDYFDNNASSWPVCGAGGCRA